VVNAIRDFPDFQPLAMLGGFLWATGNMMAVPIIQCIGLSLGLLLWGLSNLLMGWSTGTFGWFGLKPQPVPVQWLNYVGAALAVASGVLFAFIRPKEKEHEIEVPFTKEDNVINEFPQSQRQIFSLATLSPTQKRAIGVSLSVLSGLLYGSNFTPPQYIMDNCTNKCSQNGLDYVFSHFCGIFITSTAYFLAYCALKGNKPDVLPEIILPGFVSGLMWATAQVSFFIANSTISLVVSFPIMATLPGIVGSLWGILVFKEITGTRNYIFFTLAFIFVGASVTCVALSKSL